MIGPYGAATSVADYLRAMLPDHLARLQAAYGLTNPIPGPKLVTAANLPEIGPESWPALMVVPERMAGLRQIETGSSGAPEFLARYGIAVEGYLIAADPEAAGQLAQWYAVAVRSALTVAPTLRLSGQSWAASAPRVTTDSITEEYSEVFDAMQGRYAASFRTSLEVQQQEHPLGPDPSRVASAHASASIVGSARPLPVHPAYTP